MIILHVICMQGDSDLSSIHSNYFSRWKATLTGSGITIRNKYDKVSFSLLMNSGSENNRFPIISDYGGHL